MNANTDIFLSHTSALLCWQVIGHKGLDMRTATDVRTPITAASGVRVLGKAGVLDNNFIRRLGYPLDLLVPTAGKKFGSRVARCHLCTNELPEGSLRHLCEGVYITSPALTFVQLGTVLSEEQLALVGMQLCGTYFVTPRTLKASLQYRPLVTVDELREMCRPGLRIRGAGKARKVVDWVAAGSNSPRESLTFAYLTLPRDRGAYELPWPELNAAVELKANGRRIAGVAVLHPDLSWPDRKLIIEYNSHERHISEDELQDDEVRAEAFRADGWTVVMLRGQRLADERSFDVLVRNTIAPHLGVSLPPDTPEARAARVELRRQTLHFDPYAGIRPREDLGFVG